MWYTHIMNYYSAIKSNQILMRAMTWTNLGNITLSKTSQIKNDKYCITSLLLNIQIRQLDTEIGFEVTKGWGEEGMGSYYLISTVTGAKF